MANTILTAIADRTITIYNETDKLIVTEVHAGQEYVTPQKVFEGSKEAFLLEHPEYQDLNEG